MRIRADIERVLHDLKIEVARQTDREIYGHCPRHYFDPKTNRAEYDESPSWAINKKTGQHWCFSCHYGGSIFKLVMDLANVEAWEAGNWLQGRGRSLDLVELDLIHDDRSARQLPPRFLLEARYETFREPSDRALRARRLSRDAVQRYGIRWDPDAGTWILPVRSPKGKLWGWQAKSKGFFSNVPQGLRKKNTLFGIAEFQGDVAIVVESPLDVVRLATIGYHNGLAIMGSYVSDMQMDLIVDTVDAVIWALDNPAIDKAGREEALRIEKTFGGRIRNYFADYRGISAKDFGDLRDPRDIHRAIEKARLLGATEWGKTRRPSMPAVSTNTPQRPTTSQRGRPKSRPTASPSSLFSSAVMANHLG